MKELWYGDHRDLVKWGALVHLAQEEGIERIVQVPFLRETEPPRLQSDGVEFEMACEVWVHFRNLLRIKVLGPQTGIAIEVIEDAFEARKRSEYLEVVQNHLRQWSGSRKIVLLDPDTGIEPKAAKPEHVTMQEIRELWEVLSSGDWLAVYQHRYRDRNWQATTRSKFAVACGAGHDVKTFTEPTIASDVAVFAAKSGSEC
jgi:hypothetical protein